MKRRDFLKILGACVVVPGTVATTVKAKPKQYIKPIKCYGKHGQNCVCNNCIDDMIADCLPNIHKITIKKDPRYNIGNRIKASDGRVFCYMRATKHD